MQKYVLIVCNKPIKTNHMVLVTDSWSDGFISDQLMVR